ncbi:MAG TPA: glucuronate isomerase [Vicinamibacterales bacterium]|nr:glucuronate isomerase [Vicinamibacterales bacterium]
MLNPDRYFSPVPEVRRLARRLYERAAALPLVCPHGHVDPRLLAEDTPFPDPAALIVVPDHYLVRMLYSQGVPMERLGIPTRDGTPTETDPRRIWQTFAEHFYLFRGTPSAAWLKHELEMVFGITERLNGASAQRIYDQMQARLAQPEFRPRALFERFRIEVLCTTDAAGDTLEWHQKIRQSGWKGDVRPTFRPDLAIDLLHPGWSGEIDRLRRLTKEPIGDYRSYIRALESRRAFFKSMGATATDHAAVTPYTAELSEREASDIFQRALAGRATPEDQRVFTAHMLMEMARMSVEDGLVMQLHPGSARNHNEQVYRRFGPDRGCDIPVATEYTNNLRPLLNRFGNDPRFRLILFTLDESTYSRELAPLAGHYPAVLLGPPWWFHDSIEGMLRFRSHVTETAGIYNTAGFNDDTRAFLSIPARHDLARRVDAQFLADLVARHVVDEDEAEAMIVSLTYELPKRAYRLDAQRDTAVPSALSA